MSGDLESFLVTKAKMPGYTGFSPGVRAVIAKPPAMAQAVAAAATAATPRGGSTAGGATTATPFLLSSTSTTNTTTPRPNNNSTTTALFPVLQPPGPQPLARPGARVPARGVAPGVGEDNAGASNNTNNNAPTTTAADAFAPPSAEYAHVRSPMRNKDWLEGADGDAEGATIGSTAAIATDAATAGSATLRSRYASAHARIGGDAAVAAMMARMRARLLAKLSGAGDNAFRLRRLFRAYDARPATGRVSLEDFRQMSESFGLQLGDDALLALFYGADPQGTGSLEYEPLVAALLADGDAFALYSPARAAIEGAQGAVDKRAAAEAARAIAAAARGGAAAVRRVLEAMAEDEQAQPLGLRQQRPSRTPALTLLAWPAFAAGLVSVGVALSPQQQAYVRDARQAFVHATGKGLCGTVDWRRFCDALDEAGRG